MKWFFITIQTLYFSTWSQKKLSKAYDRNCFPKTTFLNFNFLKMKCLQSLRLNLVKQTKRSYIAWEKIPILKFRYAYNTYLENMKFSNKTTLGIQISGVLTLIKIRASRPLFVSEKINRRQSFISFTIFIAYSFKMIRIRWLNIKGYGATSLPKLFMNYYFLTISFRKEGGDTRNLSVNTPLEVDTCIVSMAERRIWWYYHIIVIIVLRFFFSKSLRILYLCTYFNTIAVVKVVIYFCRDDFAGFRGNYCGGGGSGARQYQWSRAIIVILLLRIYKMTFATRTILRRFVPLYNNDTNNSTMRSTYTNRFICIRRGYARPSPSYGRHRDQYPIRETSLIRADIAFTWIPIITTGPGLLYNI